jgi:hypothetical protein
MTGISEDVASRMLVSSIMGGVRCNSEPYGSYSGMLGVGGVIVKPKRSTDPAPSSGLATVGEFDTFVQCSSVIGQIAVATRSEERGKLR